MGRWKNAKDLYIYGSKNSIVILITNLKGGYIPPFLKNKGGFTMLKIKLDKEYEIKMGTLAVEKIEDEYNTTLQEFLEDAKITSKKLSFILYSSLVDCQLTLDEFKNHINTNYNYDELMIIFSALIAGKQSVEEMEKLLDSEKEKVIKKQLSK